MGIYVDTDLFQFLVWVYICKKKKQFLRFDAHVEPPVNLSNDGGQVYLWVLSVMILSLDLYLPIAKSWVYTCQKQKAKFMA